MAEMRRLWARPVVAAEWDEEYEERSAQWWELFVDLVYVAAVTNVADGLKDALEAGPRGHGATGFEAAVDFASQFTLFFTGWLDYTVFETRFIDTSLTHSVLLFFYLLATSKMVANAGSLASTQDFVSAAIFQRMALMCLSLSIYILLPRGRRQAMVDIVHLVPSVIVLGLCLLCGASQTVLRVFVALLALFELSFPLEAHIFNLLSRKGVPINIDHFQDRLGCFVMLVLGESVVSSVITEHQIEKKPPGFDTGMALSLAMTFSIALVYYAIVPPRLLNALRRSAYAGIGLVFAHWALGLALLGMGVGVKLIMAVLCNPTESALAPRAHWLLFVSLGVAMGAMMVMRMLHYWGRHPAPSDPLHIRRAKYVWWSGLALSMPLPWIVAAVTLGQHPEGVGALAALGQAVACILGFVLFETCIVHWLRAQGFGILNATPPQESSGSHAADAAIMTRVPRSHESTPLLDSLSSV